jgi:hypothetical protein
MTKAIQTRMVRSASSVLDCSVLDGVRSACKEPQHTGHGQQADHKASRTKAANQTKQRLSATQKGRNWQAECD